jgi:predicted lactoylglutathione lyase
MESGIGPAALGLSPTAVVSVDKKDIVDTIMQRVENADGFITSSARERDFGVKSVYFTDPDGNAWEALWQPTPEQPV